MASHWPKPFHASAAHIFPKPTSKVGDPPCAKGRCSLYAFPNRPTTSTIARTRRCNKSNDGCGESNSTVPKNSADEKNCADGAKLCTKETEPSASERKLQQEKPVKHSMAEAVHEAVDENDGKRDLAVAVDGSWQKRGFLRRMAW
ncbi:hypothetical protein TNCV_218861 [Trichonephila clavipes]|uniref:Uncharacterized protein n=1 Tax=Trichonephila clavipes TaxID=2585209 RepID=A0A8X6S282_TRICX|nr:hypothetical protein TNCV_218861 [Trichonephila clavipes]